LEALLAPLELDVVKAASGEEALRAMLDEDFALILMDVQMPGMDGFETATLIHSRDRSRHTPIIFLTAVYRADVERGGIAGEVDDEEDRQRDAEKEHQRPREPAGKVGDHQRNVVPQPLPAAAASAFLKSASVKP